MSLETTVWDPVDHLETEAEQLAYLEAAFEDGDPALIAAVLDDVARARGLGPQLVDAVRPDLASTIAAMRALGFELTAKAA